MNIDQIATFLDVAETGNFNRSAKNLNVTQSTVSSRIRSLEQILGRSLLIRSHAGCELTAAGHQFRSNAVGIQRLWQKSHQSIALKPGFRGVIAIGAQVSLWEHLVLDWIDWMREKAKDIAVRVEVDYSPSQMRQLADGVLDIGVMYQPVHASGLVVESLLEETLVLVSTEQRQVTSEWLERYVYVDWGDVFQTSHAEAFPQMETAAVTVGLGPLGLQYILKYGGSGYFPMRVVQPLIDDGQLFCVGDAPAMNRPAYVVYRESSSDPEVQKLALAGLHWVASNYR